MILFVNNYISVLIVNIDVLLLLTLVFVFGVYYTLFSDNTILYLKANDELLEMKLYINLDDW